MSNTGNTARIYPFQIKRRSGKYYLGSNGIAGSSSGLSTLGNLYAVPHIIGMPTSFSGMAIVSLGIAASTAAVGIYSDLNGVPNTLIYDSGAASTSTNTTIDYTFGSAIILSGVVWITFVTQSVAGQYLKYAGSSNGIFVNTSSPYNQSVALGFLQTGITGAMPSTWGATLTETLATAIPMVWLKTS